MTKKSQAQQLYVGLISGTSMDGVDAALVDITASRCKLLATRDHPYPEDLRDALMHASRNPEDCTVDTIGHLDQWVGEVFRDATLSLLHAHGTAPDAVTAIGSHGQTVRHQPRAERPFTLQLGDPNVIAAGTGILTIADFRRRDIALGGEGAPLAPAFHQWLLADAQDDQVVLNIGGFSNITVLPADAGAVSGFDTGPGNSLLDLWCAQHRNKPYDENGAWAASGNCNDALLKLMLADPYFAAAPPKSTGFEYFNREWLERHLQVSGQVAPEDVQATLTELTALSIAAAIAEHAPGTRDVFVCGGGAHNSHLLARLAAAMSDRTVRDPGELGISADWVEAVAFAWLAARHVAGLPGNLPSVTGASSAAVLGASFPGTR